MKADTLHNKDECPHCRSSRVKYWQVKCVWKENEQREYQINWAYAWHLEVDVKHTEIEMPEISYCPDCGNELKHYMEV